MSITVTKPYLPPKEEYIKYVSDIFESGFLTNQGPVLNKLESHLRKYLGVENFHYVTNGTIALQLAIRALGIEGGEIITTPFSYVATTSSILWEHCTPVYVDIETDNFTIDVNKIEDAITSETRAIMPVHVFGYACNIDKIQEIADKYNLKVIYDAAHAFGSVYKGRALSSYGDISTLSFHATKLFHTIEGGGLVARDKDVSEKIRLIKQFGHDSDQYICLGINAKQDEFNAAMGLSNLNHINEILSARKKCVELYDDLLNGTLGRPKKQLDLIYNYAYYPVIFESERVLSKILKKLAENDIFPRRYFYPSLNTLPYLERNFNCPISQDISQRIACLPLYYGLEDNTIEQICGIILNNQ